MNEELKIIIKAVTDEAKKNIEGVKKELEGVKDSSQESSKAVDTAMKGMAKGVLAAVAAITALTTAMAALGRSAQEVQKGFSKLNTTFQNNGATTAQAANAYKELFSYIGDHDKAIETAQSLALITTNEEELAKWTTALGGAFAEMGDKLPIEGLAEAANATAKIGQVDGVMADALEWKGINLDNYNAALAECNSLEEREALILSTLNNLYSNSAKLYQQNNQATIQYNKSQANLNIALAQASSYTTPLLTSLNNLSTTLLTSFGPALQSVAIYLTAFVQLMAEAVVWVGNFFGLIGASAGSAAGDVEGYQKAMKNYQESLGKAFGTSNGELDKNLQKINAVKKATMGFDELNVVSSGTSASTGGAATGGATGTIPTAPNPADFGIGFDAASFASSLEEAKEKLKGILVIAGAIAATIGAWKLANFVSDIREAYKVWNTPIKELGPNWKQQAEDAELLQNKIKTMSGYLLIIAGLILLVKGYSDAWANGIDWENFALILAGIGLTVGGLYLAFGTLAAQIGLIVGGILLLVLGIKDLVENGYSMEAVIMIVVGVLLILVGVVWAFNAALLANPITWIIAAIIALVAVFVILWNECDWFREFWINLWEGAKKVFSAVWDWIKKFFTETIPNIFKAVINFIKENWQALLLLIVNPFAGAFKLLYDNCEGFRNFIDKWIDKIKTFFKNLVQGIKDVFKGIGDWFKNIFTGAVDGVKKAFSTVGGFFEGIWDGIKKGLKGALNFMIGLVNKWIDGLNILLAPLRGIVYGVAKAFGSNIKFSDTKIPNIPKLAKGGIATGPTVAMFGEAGREAVLPLDNNTEWIDMLADRLAARQGTPSKIVLALDGRELGYATINSINDITKQTGKLQLAWA